MTDNVAERLARWDRSHDPSDLWPGVTPQRLRAAQEVIGQVSKRLVSGEATASIDLADGMPARLLGITALAAGMGPLLGYWVEQGRLRADDAAKMVLQEHLRHGRARIARLQAGVTPFLQECAAQNVPILALKGFHTGWEYFPEPGTRPLGDIDLFTPQVHFETARSILRDLGFEERGTHLLPHRSDWYPPGRPATPVSLEITHVDNPWSIDLHCSLHHEFVPGIAADLPSPRIEQCRTTDIHGSELRVLSHPLHLAYLAFHTSADLNTVQLMRLIELGWVANRDFRNDDDWRVFDAYVEESRIQRFVYPALSLAGRLMPGAVDAVTLSTLAAGIPGRMRRFVSRVSPTAPQSLFHRSIAGELIWAAGPSDLWRWLKARVLGHDHARGAPSPHRWLTAFGRRAKDLARGRLRLRG